jgi:hypothetical protein
VKKSEIIVIRTHSIEDWSNKKADHILLIIFNTRHAFFVYLNLTIKPLNDVFEDVEERANDAININSKAHNAQTRSNESTSWANMLASFEQWIFNENVSRDKKFSEAHYYNDRDN